MPPGPFRSLSAGHLGARVAQRGQGGASEGLPGKCPPRPPVERTWEVSARKPRGPHARARRTPRPPEDKLAWLALW